MALTDDQHAEAMSRSAVLAILCVGNSPERWASSITSLVAADVAVLVLVDGDPSVTVRMYDGLPIRVETWTLSEAGAHLAGGSWSAGFIATSPVVVPRTPFENALAAIEHDIRICSVSFLSNNANYLSFPVRNSPSGTVVNGHDERSLTRRLREEDRGQKIVPIPAPAGGGILFSALAIRALGGIDGLCPSAETSLLDLALRGIKRGFRNVLDATTFIVRPSQAGDGADALNDPAARDWLRYRHHFFPTLYDVERDAQASPLADALAFRRASVRGLRVLIDGGCLGPFEMGTQVAVLAQIDALVDHPDVSEVVVGTPDGRIPPYARTVLMRPEVRVCAEANGMFPGAGSVDILHRPFQPIGQLPFDHWRRIARRSVITVQDLIAYDNGNYHATDRDWLSYRESMTAASGQVDAMIAISHDTADAIRQNRLPVSRDALYVIENGTDHLTPGASTPLPPMELIENNFVSSDFILVLGASYSHKNRDLAIKAWQELRQRGNAVELVLAGVIVPIGSTRNDEALVAAKGEWPITLADVTSAERDWLLQHAAVVLYPTSAEGFGLVPFEAAVMGTPTVFVEFGPLQEMLSEVPVRAGEWTAAALADCVAALMTDPDLARRQVQEVLKVSEEFTWSRYAAKLVDVYKNTLGSAVAR